MYLYLKNCWNILLSASEVALQFINEVDEKANGSSGFFNSITLESSNH